MIAAFDPVGRLSAAAKIGVSVEARPARSIELREAAQHHLDHVDREQDRGGGAGDAVGHRRFSHDAERPRDVTLGLAALPNRAAREARPAAGQWC